VTIELPPAELQSRLGGFSAAALAVFPSLMPTAFTQRFLSMLTINLVAD